MLGQGQSRIIKSKGPKIPIDNNECPSEDRDIVAPFAVQENYALNVEMEKRLSI
jgi:hypothetical protein